MRWRRNWSARRGNWPVRAFRRRCFDDARTAMDAARAIGELDIGQAAVAVNGLVVAVEAAEGTDAMLERVGELHSKGRVKWSGRAGVLAKCSKPQQDLRVDMPTIGPRTVMGVAKAGLAGIVVEAGRVMIAERAETVKAADESGTFILGSGRRRRTAGMTTSDLAAGRPLKVFLIAGEESGDALGGRADAGAYRSDRRRCRFLGVGGCAHGRLWPHARCSRWKRSRCTA